MMITVSNNTYPTKMLGVVTLYNPEPEEAASNIMRYISNLDALIVWDNSPLEKNVKNEVLGRLSDVAEKIVWHGDGKNYCIAPAINFAWHHAAENGYDLILLMDEDSAWEDFEAYRKDVTEIYDNGRLVISTPYVVGCDSFEISQQEQRKDLFINSGTVIPTQIMTELGGVDEDAFPLDAVDHDIAFRARGKGYDTVCLTNHKLNHSLGYPQRLGIFKIFTPNYNAFRTFTMTRSHVICYRKHHKIMSKEEKQYVYREMLLNKFARILLAEPEKWSRLKAFVKGIISGLRYKIKKNEYGR